MKLNDLFEAFVPNGVTSNADSETGFYGKWGAGCIPFSKATKRFLIAHRSNNPPPRDVEQPGTWGTWGGAGVKNPEYTVRMELSEETGFSGHFDLLPIFVFNSGSFRYSNFIAVMDDEYTPRLNWESQGFRWCDFGDWPSPLHFGLKAILADPTSISTMKKLAGTD